MEKYGKNPLTKNKYKRGDLSANGQKKFWSYKTGYIKKNGEFSGIWLSLSDYSDKITSTSEKQKKYTQENRKKNLEKRINPLTKVLFKSGDQDINNENRYFIGYVSGQKTSDGFHGESWGSWDAYIRVRVGNTFNKLKRRASKKHLPVNVDIDFLVLILPKNMQCPILETKMIFGGKRSNSPSIDRLNPKKGYTKGNVAWVSMLANTVKDNRTPNELRKIADWIEKQEIYKQKVLRK